jgi:hypothetical protein
MHPRYDEPGEPPPDPLLLNHYLRLSSPNQKASQEERRAAEAALLRLYADQRQQVSDGKRSAIDGALMFFVRETLRRCMMQPDPLGAVESLLEQNSRPRGRPKTPHRDFVIAGDIHEMAEAGMAVDRACEQLEAATGLKVEHLRRIYFDQKKADEPSLEIDLIRRHVERNSLQTVRADLIALLETVRADLIALLKTRASGGLSDFTREPMGARE